MNKNLVAVLSLVVTNLLMACSVSSPQDPDEASFLCASDLARDGMGLWDDMDRVLSSAMDGDWMGGLCKAESLWRSRVDDLKSRLPCPTPSDPDLALANEYVRTAIVMDLDRVLYSAAKQCEFPDQYWDDGVIDGMVEGYDMLAAALQQLETYSGKQ